MPVNVATPRPRGRATSGRGHQVDGSAVSSTKGSAAPPETGGMNATSSPSASRVERRRTRGSRRGRAPSARRPGRAPPRRPRPWRRRRSSRSRRPGPRVRAASRTGGRDADHAASGRRVEQGQRARSCHPVYPRDPVHRVNTLPACRPSAPPTPGSRCRSWRATPVRTSSASPAGSRSPAASAPTATAAAPGRCASTPASLGGGDERALQAAADARPDGSVDRVRPADPARAGLRRPARPRRGRAAPAWPSTRVDGHARCSTAIPLGEVSTSMTINAPASILLLLYELVGAEQGVDAGRALAGRSRTTCSRSTSRAATTSSRRGPRCG